MSDINGVQLSGRIGTQPEIKYFESGAVKCKISIGVNRWSAKEKKEIVTWLDCQAWGKKAEFVAEYAHSGDMVFIFGSLQKDIYTDTDGKKRAIIYVLIDEIKIMAKKQQ